ncbi:MAG TPA: hypothetical protein VN372_05425 [Methanospirillum sp.]|nr:hypothetical protein [Methanospirillum sp.]
MNKKIILLFFSVFAGICLFTSPIHAGCGGGNPCYLQVGGFIYNSEGQVVGTQDFDGNIHDYGSSEISEEELVSPFGTFPQSSLSSSSASMSSTSGIPVQSTENSGNSVKSQSLSVGKKQPLGNVSNMTTANNLTSNLTLINLTDMERNVSEVDGYQVNRLMIER